MLFIVVSLVGKQNSSTHHANWHEHNTVQNYATRKAIYKAWRGENKMPYISNALHTFCGMWIALFTECSFALFPICAVLTMFVSCAYLMLKFWPATNIFIVIMARYQEKKDRHAKKDMEDVALQPATAKGCDKETATV